MNYFSFRIYCSRKYKPRNLKEQRVLGFVANYLRGDRVRIIFDYPNQSRQVISFTRDEFAEFQGEIASVDLSQQDK